MADTVTAHDRQDPFEFYRDNPPDPNDPLLRSQLKMSPIGNDHGQELNVSGHISADQLEDIADRSRFIENGPKGLGKVEEIRELLHRRGHDTPNPRGRTYHYSR